MVLCSSLSLRIKAQEGNALMLRFAHRAIHLSRAFFLCCVFGSEWPPTASWDSDSITSGMPNYFPTRVRRIFYVTSTLLPCFQNSAPARVFVWLTHFSGKHQAVDCISLLCRTSECKHTGQWGLASHRAKPGLGL